MPVSSLSQPFLSLSICCCDTVAMAPHVQKLTMASSSGLLGGDAPTGEPLRSRDCHTGSLPLIFQLSMKSAPDAQLTILDLSLHHRLCDFPNVPMMGSARSAGAQLCHAVNGGQSQPIQHMLWVTCTMQSVRAHCGCCMLVSHRLHRYVIKAHLVDKLCQASSTKGIARSA